MFQNFVKKISFLFSLINLCFFEVFIFSALDKSIFGILFNREYIWQLIVLNFIIQGSSIFYLATIKKIRKENYFHFTLPVLLNIALIGFLFFSPIFILNQVVLIISLIFLNLMFLNIAIGTKFVFTNIISFFTIFLFFFDAYSLFFVSSFPYWVAMIFVASFSVLILDYKLKHLNLSQKYIYLFVALFSIIISEFFLFSFFWPLKSIFIKSIFLLFFYYLYWGFTDIYIGDRFNPIMTIKYIVLFFILSGLAIGSLFLNIKL
jgi:hypothetical protein